MKRAKRIARRPRRIRRNRMIKAYLTLITVAAVLVLALPTVIVTLVCMVPTMVTWIVDLTPGRHAVRCVAALNFAGASPFLLRLWADQNDIAHAFRVIADPMLWLLSYGGAGFGWALFFSLPGLIFATKMFNARRRAVALRERQGRLIREWGKTIAGENWRGFSDDVEYFESEGNDDRPGVGAEPPGHEDRAAA